MSTQKMSSLDALFVSLAAQELQFYHFSKVTNYSNLLETRTIESCETMKKSCGMWTNYNWLLFLFLMSTNG